MSDYFNYNLEKCPLYTSGKYNPTNIIIGISVDKKINPEIKTEIISEKKYLFRKNRIGKLIHLNSIRNKRN